MYLNLLKTDLGNRLNSNLILYFDDLANPKIGLKSVQNRLYNKDVIHNYITNKLI
jgi:hypothetical protein